MVGLSPTELMPCPAHIKIRLCLCKDAISFHTNLTEICILYGFKDYASFFRAFKKEFGMSPKKFKELSARKDFPKESHTSK